MAAMGFSSQSCASLKSSPFPPPYFCFCRSFPFSTSRSSWAASRILHSRDESYEVHATVVPFSNSPDLGNSFEKISTYKSRQRTCGYPLKFEVEPVTQDHTTLSRLSLNQQLASVGTISSARDQYHVSERPVILRTWTDEAVNLGKEKENYSKQRNGGTYIRAQVGRSSNVNVIPNCVSTTTCFPSDPVVIPSPVDNETNGFPLGSCVEEQERSLSISDGDPIPVSTSVENKLNFFPLRPCVDKQEGSISIADDDNVDGRVQNDEKSVKTTNKKKKESVKTDEVDDGQTQKLKLTEEKINQLKLRERLGMVYEKVLIVDTISSAKEVVLMLTSQYRHLVHACDTEVSNIDVKQETPVDHGEIICFSIYSGPTADFGNGKSCIWVDVLNGGGKKIVEEFAPFFESPEIRKVWHNYSFDCHVIKNYGVKVAGFHADTMHMARLWDSSRRTDGGYSLEALTGNSSVMSGAKLCRGEELIGKVSMKTIFGCKKLKKDGSEGKVSIIPSVEELQTTERVLWICYSALDSISTLKLYQSLGKKLSQLEWKLDGVRKGSMFNFYENYWRPFGELLVTMESHGMQVDRSYLAEIEKVAIAEQRIAVDKFRNWASKYCPDAKYMNVGSDMQLRQLFFGGIQNAKDHNEFLPVSKEFKIPNIDLAIEDGKKAPKKYRAITLRRIFDDCIETDMYTPNGWPSVSGDALKALAKKYAVESEPSMVPVQSEIDGGDVRNNVDKQASSEADTEPQIGASDAISALCEVCSIDSLISNFILPLQGPHIAGKNLRIHCSLNINTETGRLSARRPNLQNQPALEKDRYKIRQAFIAEPGNSLIVADYGQLELRILAHLANCKSMLHAFEAGGDFHSRTAMNMYPHIRQAIQEKKVLLEWHPQPGEDKPPVPLLKDAFASERRKAKMLNFSIAYGKTPVGLARDWKVSVEEAKKTVNLWYSDRKEVLSWQEQRKTEARKTGCVHTLLGRARQFPSHRTTTPAQKSHIDRAAINTPVQGSAADVAMCAMLQISREPRLKKLGWKLLLQIHDEVILEGPTESAEIAKDIVVDCMSKPFDGKNILKVDLAVDAKCAKNWYGAK